MSITITLPDDVEAQLQRAAESRAARSKKWPWKFCPTRRERGRQRPRRRRSWQGSEPLHRIRKALSRLLIPSLRH